MAICRLTSRNGNEFKSFPELNDEIPDNPSPHSAIFDAEIVCLDGDGKPQFRDLATVLWVSRRNAPFSSLAEVEEAEDCRTGCTVGAHPDYA